MRKIKPPFEPHVKGPEDASQFDKCGEDNLPQSTYVLYEDEFAEF